MAQPENPPGVAQRQPFRREGLRCGPQGDASRASSATWSSRRAWVCTPGRLGTRAAHQRPERSASTSWTVIATTYGWGTGEEASVTRGVGSPVPSAGEV